VLLWRISNHAVLEGTGGLLASGRWHSKGHPVIYCAPDPSTALLEVLVHTGEIDLADAPVTFQFLKIDVPSEVSETFIALEHLPQNWPKQENTTRRIGDSWLMSNTTALLRVPSVLVPETWNTLINPRHPDSQRLRIVKTIAYLLDGRLR
jgi:RES domain-containing protein